MASQVGGAVGEEVLRAESLTTTGGSTDERIEWSDALVESLLFLRMHKYGPAFKGSMNKAQLAAAWAHVLDDFNEENHRSCRVTQLKNKFQGLKTMFNNIKASEPQTGNSTEHPIEYPSCWPMLIMYFGDLTGMGNRDFGQTGSNNSEASATEPAEQPRTVITEGSANKRQARKRKMDLASAVALIAESLSSRLNANEGTNEMQPIMTKMARMEEQLTGLVANQQHTLELMQASIDGSRQVNAAILAFMQRSTAQHDEQTGNP
ncbi:hypothetical protein PF005_g29262 [Phytophthora fragariae]|uniref:Myb/SANT-like domain-containing protein n=1 Tax=Phytophthora fragariae TaxID=53985 RepID=A0A6A4BCJ1_9STRA|nr:hypothetical protein PF003_g10983 [Phytophthora fragariae]KAE8920515.1 hypothetical protein PF009_g29191 [Phytophthora fragariae]KAE9065705.1 hypothetical protein PF007_g28756 [Phytophthora fragariae]KAE9075261.1 hypothetical protein PF006_g28365 [Phytophthora fragariae]KAE9166278.1 hypothetical protein PF005_g29262 [Phytophthora fragariae]